MRDRALVLIVDDSEDSRYVHARYIRQAGFDVVEAGGGLEGLALAPRADLVLLDVRLPDVNGLEVCRRLKADPRTASIPVLQTSASFVSVRDKVNGLAGGADAYLTVPVEPAELIATLQSLLRMRRAEQALAAHAGDLEKRVEARTRELAARNEELEAFTYSVSHDLRAPLKAMQNFAAILLEEASDRLEGEHIDYLRRIEAAAIRMDRLTRDLLAYSQLAQAAADLGPVDVEAPLREIVEALEQEGAAKPGSFVFERPFRRVRGNRAILAQALQNLLANAAKFARPDAPLRVVCRTEAVAGDRVRVVVEDNGIGIEARYLGKIFKPFEKLHPPSQYPGTGIGLAIVRRGAERMGGCAGAESGLGVGSRFWIELPAA